LCAASCKTTLSSDTFGFVDAFCIVAAQNMALISSRDWR
jgi:hypothetical protein